MMDFYIVVALALFSIFILAFLGLGGALIYLKMNKIHLTEENKKILKIGMITSGIFCVLFIGIEILWYWICFLGKD